MTLANDRAIRSSDSVLSQRMVQKIPECIGKAVRVGGSFVRRNARNHCFVKSDQFFERMRSGPTAAGFCAVKLGLRRQQLYLKLCGGLLHRVNGRRGRGVEPFPPHSGGGERSVRFGLHTQFAAVDQCAVFQMQGERTTFPGSTSGGFFFPQSTHVDYSAILLHIMHHKSVECRWRGLPKNCHRKRSYS